MVLLEDQDRSLWDRRLVALGFAHFERSAEGPQHERLPRAGGDRRRARRSRARRRRRDGTASSRSTTSCWRSTRRRSSASTAPSRCRASPARPRRSRRSQPLESEPALANYYLLPSVKARLLAELGDRASAAACYRAALERPAANPSGGSCRGGSRAQSSLRDFDPPDRLTRAARGGPRTLRSPRVAQSLRSRSRELRGKLLDTREGSAVRATAPDDEPTPQRDRRIGQLSHAGARLIAPCCGITSVTPSG